MRAIGGVVPRMTKETSVRSCSSCRFTSTFLSHHGRTRYARTDRHATPVGLALPRGPWITTTKLCVVLPIHHLISRRCITSYRVRWFCRDVTLFSCDGCSSKTICHLRHKLRPHYAMIGCHVSKSCSHSSMVVFRRSAAAFVSRMVSCLNSRLFSREPAEDGQHARL